MTPLIVRADDAGSCPEANRAIAECVDAGVVQCISVMAIGGFLADAAERLAHRTEVEFGFHFALNAEWEVFAWRPVSAPESVPSLVDTRGELHPMPADIKAHGIAITEAMTEARAQLAALRRAGFAPTYLDEHCGVSGISKDLRDALAAFAQSEGLFYTTRFPTVPVSFADAEGIAAAPPASTNTATRLWVTHPGIAEPGGTMARFHLHGQPDNGAIAHERDAERRVLCDPRLPKTLRALGYTLAPYKELAPHMATAFIEPGAEIER